MNEEILNNLEHENKLKRRNALTRLQNFVETTETLTLDDYKVYEISLMSCLSDVSEINRNKACKILEIVLGKGLKSKSMLNHIVPILHHRLSCAPVIEECEENRLEFLVLIEIMLDIFKVEMQIYSNDLCNIFIASLQDKNPELILKTCDCIVKLPSILGHKFQMFSNTFIKFLLLCISKNRLKVRLKGLKTLECIYTHGNVLEFGEETNILRKCMNDVPQVRLALLSLGYVLCCKMKERYTYWQKILPFVLFGLRDNDEEIQRAAKVFWEEIGTRYETENDIKSLCKLNTKCEMISEVRSLDFSIGCCELIRRNFHRMFEEINVSVRDWQEDVRLNSLILLTVSLMGLEESSLQYSPKIIDILRVSVNDNDFRIVNECLLCAKVLGQSLPPDLYIPLIEHSLWEEGNEGSMHIFSCLVKTTPAQHLQTHIHLFIKVLSFTNIVYKVSVKKQRLILNIFEKLLTCKFEKFEVNMFFTLFYLIENKNRIEEEKEQGFAVMQLAAKCYGNDSVDNFISENMKECLTRLKDSTVWIEEDDPSLRVYLFLSLFKGFELNLEKVSEILKTKVDFNTAPLVAFTVLQGITNVFRRVAQNRDEKLLQVWSSFLLKDFILKMLAFVRGRTGESLRLASVSCLVSVVKDSGKENRFVYEAIEDCMQNLEGLTREDYIETRILSCNFIDVYVENYATFLEPDNFFKLIQMLINRLDDANIKVRRLASSCLLNCFRNYCRGTENAENMTRVVNSVTVYLKEDDDFVKQNILALFEILRTACPNQVEKELRNEENFDISNEILNIKMT